MQLKPGQRITAPFLSAIAKVKIFTPRSQYYMLEVVLEDEHNTYYEIPVSNEQLAQIKVIDDRNLVRVDNAENFFLTIEAHRLRLAHQFDPQLAVSVSQVDPLPHQIEAVYHYVLQSPRIRFLIADDPGAGKTIMAGLIIKELQLRRMAQRILIVAPGHLKYQWQREMKERFSESFAIVDRGFLNNTWSSNAWEEHNLCIASTDFIKQDKIRESLSSVRWDLVIVDEAHKMSAYLYETKNQRKIEKTKRYRAGEMLSQQSEHMLFLTATPHKGDEENFRLFLDLLRPGFFARKELLQESIEAGDNPIFVRRLKEDMCHFDGRRIFPERHVKSVGFRLTEAERELYNGVTRYVQESFDQAKEHRSISFALMILQRRLTSSTYSVYRSLQRRKSRLEELLALPEKISQEQEDYLRANNLTPEEIDDLPEAERKDIENRLEHLTIAKNIEQVRKEIDDLSPLIEQAETVREQAIESKLTALHDDILNNLGTNKLLIFTEFKDTLNYLAGNGKNERPLGKLREWGYDVVTIDGSMNMDARIEAEQLFKDRAQIMVATEAAGEGINLQFCSLMVNYDIPWNPNRLEQRMGRIHRYGQNDEVYIWNLIALDTREGQILNRLFEKLNQMRKALGSDRVFDIIGEMLPGTRLDELLRDAIFSQQRIEEITQHIEDVDEIGLRQTMEVAFLTGLATRHIDYTGLQSETLAAEERSLMPEYVEDYFLRAFRQLGGKVTPRRGKVENAAVYHVPRLPYEIRRWKKEARFKTTYGQLREEYRHITFDKAYAREHREVDFVAPGHPLLEAVSETILSKSATGADNYAVFSDPEGTHEGVLWFVEGAINDGSGKVAGKRVFCLYQNLVGELNLTNPAVLWDCMPLNDVDPTPSQLALLKQRDDVEDTAIVKILFPYQKEIAERRTHESKIKEKYGLRSLDYLIQESNQKILDYQLRQTRGEIVDLPLLNEQRNLEQLRERRKALEHEIHMESQLKTGAPKILGAAIIIPNQQKETEPGYTYPLTSSTDPIHREPKGGYSPTGSMRRDDEAEAVGMREAMAYENTQGRKAEDVSDQNLGFDVRSIAYNEDGTLAGILYIEVKARAQSGAVRISANEWKKARHFSKDFWLYIVTGAKTESPELHRIQNPAAHFRVGEGIEVTGYIIKEESWREQKMLD